MLPDHSSCQLSVNGLLWTQLLSMGLLWITLHCSGMCGPIVTGLLVHHTRQGASATARERVRCRVQGVLAYQSGRAVTYAIIGALAGLVGAGFDVSIEPVARAASVLAALIVGGMAWASWRDRGGQVRAQMSVQLGRRLGGLMRWVGVLVPAPGPSRMAVFGAIMGLLPCMIMFWVLGIAISSSDPLQGALMMITLVAMTTPMMLAVAASVGWVSHRFRAHLSAMVPVMMSMSAAWMALVALAANGLIAHQSVTFEVLGTTYVVMFF